MSARDDFEQPTYAELMAEVIQLRAMVAAYEEDGTERRKKRRSTPEDEKCARWIFGLILNTNPGAKKPNWLTWADDVRMMREIDGRAHRDICELFQWAHQDSFWCANILSPKKLRDKWDQLTIKRGPPAGSAPSNLGKAGQATARAALDWAGGHS